MAEPNSLGFRVAQLERELRELEQSVKPIPVHEYRIGALERAMTNLAAALDRNTGAILGSALALVVALVAASITLFITLG